jgi:hypothetical protein
MYTQQKRNIIMSTDTPIDEKGIRQPSLVDALIPSDVHDQVTPWDHLRICGQ